MRITRYLDDDGTVIERHEDSWWEIVWARLMTQFDARVRHRGVRRP